MPLAPPPGGKLEVKTLLFALPFTEQNLPGVRFLMSNPPSFPLDCGETRKVTALLFNPAITLPRGWGGGGGGGGEGAVITNDWCN